MASDESNNSLYFIVGGLVVVAVIFGFMVWGPVNPAGVYPATLEPTSGTSTSTQTDQTRIEYNSDDGTKSITETTETKSEDQ